jgi:hypothetical protein
MISLEKQEVVPVNLTSLMMAQRFVKSVFISARSARVNWISV